MITEREHWLQVTRSRDWKREHIFDPNICPAATLNAITAALPEDPQSILEIGCGFGRLASLVAQQYPDAIVTGLDINPDILDHGLQGVTYVCGDSLWAVPKQDAIYSVALFQHLPDAEKAAYIAQAAERLNPGGVLRIQFIEGVRDNFNDHWVSLEQMQRWFTDSGFTAVSHERGLAHPQWTWMTGVQ